MSRPRPIEHSACRSASHPTPSRVNRPSDPLAPPKVTVATVLQHFKLWGRIATILVIIVAAIMIAAACNRLVSPVFAGFITTAIIIFWYRLVYREARYDAYGDLIMMTDNNFPEY